MFYLYEFRRMAYFHFSMQGIPGIAGERRNCNEQHCGNGSNKGSVVSLIDGEIIRTGIKSGLSRFLYLSRFKGGDRTIE